MSFNVSEWIIRIAVLLFAVTIHEYAHGRAALALGDPTAKNAGRLTLNPIAHIDPIGAICLIFFYFGWAKPVPVDTRYFQDMRRDTVIMALAGPISNIATAFVAGLLVRFDLPQSHLYQLLLIYLLIMNIGLGLFNLLPIPPPPGRVPCPGKYTAAIRFMEISSDTEVRAVYPDRHTDTGSLFTIEYHQQDSHYSYNEVSPSIWRG